MDISVYVVLVSVDIIVRVDIIVSVVVLVRQQRQVAKVNGDGSVYKCA